MNASWILQCKILKQINDEFVRVIEIRSIVVITGTLSLCHCTLFLHYWVALNHVLLPDPDFIFRNLKGAVCYKFIYPTNCRRVTPLYSHVHCHNGDPWCYIILETNLTQWNRGKWPTFCRPQFQCIFLYENILNTILILLTYVSGDPIDYKLAFVRIMAWRRTGKQPLFEPIMDYLMIQWARCLFTM